ncbi:Putative gag protein [Arachis hypogaea]|nr:Putative gag protein [Arachis hypogaea]
MGLVHGQHGQLEQIEQEIERQREVERDLRKEAEWEENPLGEEDPFIEEIMRVRFPRNFKSPDMNLYDETTDLRHHLSNFKSRIYLADASNATRCKTFPTMLTKEAMKWFDNLPPRKICHIEKLPLPCPIKHKKAGSRTEYCEYHKLYEHSTNDCYDMKNVIEKLVREGRLDRYLADRPDDPGKRKRGDEDGNQLD